MGIGSPLVDWSPPVKASTGLKRLLCFIFHVDVNNSFTGRRLGVGEIELVKIISLSRVITISLGCLSFFIEIKSV